MTLLEQFIEQAAATPKRIVFPEGGDARILRAAARARELGIAHPFVLGNPDEVRALAASEQVPLDGIELIAVTDEARLDRYAEEYVRTRDVPPGVARKLVRKPLAFGGMMVRLHEADGMVAGAASTTASVIQFASMTIGFLPGVSTASSFFLMVLPAFDGEAERPLIFADCGVVVSPTAQQLGEIGVASARSARALLGIEPKAAFLSFSTKGSATHADTEKVIAAVEAARALDPATEYDGELQGDAALVPRVAEKKAPGSRVAGQANVLIFPDLDAGNIAYKLVQYLARAAAIGPFLQGFARPVSDLSRGATVEDIVHVTAITVIEAHAGCPA